MRRILIFAVSLGLLGIAAVVEQANAQSVLKISRGLKSNNVSVFIDRAVVLESGVRFLEVSVANPEIADVSPLSDRSVYIFGRRRGTTTLTLLGEGGRLITNVTIKVEADHSELKQRLRQLLPREPIEVRTANGGLVLSGVVSGKEKVDRAMTLARAYAGDAVANMMTVGGTQQVMLKVKIAEISRGNGKELGISFAGSGGNNNVAIGGSTGTGLRNDGAGGIDQLIPDLGSFAGYFGAAVRILDDLILAIQIDALEQKGFARTLAEPNLVALSGSEAEFLAGGEVPIPVLGEDGQVTIEFKPIGVNLIFRPTVLDSNIINLDLSASVSSPDASLSTTTGGIEVLGFNVRRATTTVELKDGQAFAIAGLLRETFTDSIGQVPWLGDLPVIGPIFRSTNYQKNLSEVVIMVSAHLVAPVDDESELSLPTDRIAIPNERQLFLSGMTHDGAGPGEGEAYTGAGFDGDYGYVVE